MNYPNLADNKLGSTGHSQGGQAAFTTLQLAEAKWGSQMIYAGLAMEPASGFGDQPAGGTWQMVYGEIKSPMFMFSGTADMLVSAAWVGEAYSAMNPKNEVYWWSATGATHIPTPQVPEEQVSIPGFAGSSWATTPRASSSRRCRVTPRSIQAGPRKCRRTRRPASNARRAPRAARPRREGIGAGRLKGAALDGAPRDR